ncbi:MAG: TrbI/VirB10 family protein [Leptolyngbya sp. SIOISBB]|nr:TrbI/VirB10 family protein [Leptolyngbya sp. SIOISBB]
MAVTNGREPVPNMQLLDPSDMGAALRSERGTSTEEMASWMGIEGESEASVSTPVLDAENGEAAPSDDEDGDLQVDDQGKTKTPLWANPLVKLIFVGGVAGSCLLIVGLVVQSIQNAGSRDLLGSSTVTPVEVEEPEDPMQSALRQQEQQIGSLKTQNALGTQQLAMQLQDEAGQGGTSEVSAADLLALRNQLQRRQEQQAQATNQTNQPNQTQPTITNRPVPRPTTVASPRPPTVATPVAPTSVARSLPPAPPPLSPQEQLTNLTGYGSYGSGSALPANTIAAVPIAAPGNIGEIASPQAEMPPAVPSFSDAGVASAPIPAFQAGPKQVDNTYAAEEAAILGNSLITVQAGTYAQATLETPIYWAQDLANEQQSQRTALRLSEPLYGSRGEVALEAGTLLVAEVNVIAGSGLLQMYVTDVVVTQDGQQQVMSIPHQNLVIAGREGQPLIAREIQNTGEIRAAELQLAALGALGNVGELLNRPDSSTTIIGGDTSVSTVENGAVNILAGLLAGAADAVLPIEQARVEGRIDDYENQPRIWYHGSDAPVMLFVADEFIFQAD